MKYIYILGLIVVLLAAGCSSVSDNNEASTNTVVKDSPEGTPDANSRGAGSEGVVASAPAPENEGVQEAVVAPEITSKSFEMIAKQWEFVPDTITVNKGDTVHISVKSIDVSHGFALPDFGVNEYLAPGKAVDVEFVADKAGTYTFFCSVQCGAGHRNMRGKLVVE